MPRSVGLALLLLLAAVARPAAPPTGLDRAGDPRAPGAVARFGSAHFCRNIHPGGFW
jgi:hypothetical protein